MGAWTTYVKERFPLPVYLLLVAGMAGSGVRLAGGEVASVEFGLAAGGLLLFFALLRLMDEVKDLDKDRVAYPQRPLPRGLLAEAQVRRVINAGVLVMFAVAGALFALGWRAGGAVYAAITVYLWLMYREFGIHAWLEPRTLIYAVSHQVVTLLLCAYPAALAGGAEALRRPATWWYGAAATGAFWAWEVSRKLAPDAHPLLRTYRALYGLGGALALIVAGTALSAVSAWQLDRQLVSWPLLGLVLLSLAAARGAKGPKVVEGAASLSLIGHFYLILIGTWLT